MTSVRRAYLQSRPALLLELARAGFSEAQLSRRAGLSAEAVSDLVMVRRACCSLEDGREIADALGCRFGDLLSVL